MQVHLLGLFRRSYRAASWHLRLNRRSLWTILFILMFPACCLSGEGKSITITVTADHAKANGAPWDGIPGIGAGRGQSATILDKNAPPDLAVCVVRLEAPPECSMRYVNLKQYSLCQASELLHGGAQPFAAYFTCQ